MTTSYDRRVAFRISPKLGEHLDRVIASGYYGDNAPEVLRTLIANTALYLDSLQPYKPYQTLPITRGPHVPETHNESFEQRHRRTSLPNTTEEQLPLQLHGDDE